MCLYDLGRIKTNPRLQKSKFLDGKSECAKTNKIFQLYICNELAYIQQLKKGIYNDMCALEQKQIDKDDSRCYKNKLSELDCLPTSSIPVNQLSH